VVESKGFQRVQQTGVIVNTSERARIDVTLSVGQVTDTVNVTAETPLLQSERVTIGQVVEQRTIQSIPLATRNFTQILGTSAGVVGSVFNADNPGTGSDSVSVNGARRGSNNLLVDGVPTTNPLNNAPDGDGTPSIEFLSEFKVMTSLFSAEYGRNLGSTINVTTRSGTNQLHAEHFAQCAAVLQSDARAEQPEPVRRQRGRAGGDPETVQRQGPDVLLLRLGELAAVECQFEFGGDFAHCADHGAAQRRFFGTADHQ
jgi:hypothetical protein